MGFDINHNRVVELQGGQDHTLECSPAELQQAQFYIVTVPTTVDNANRPDMPPLVKASTTVGRALKQGDEIIHESTVYPGATEEVCVPVLEQHSGLQYSFKENCPDLRNTKVVEIVRQLQAYNIQVDVYDSWIDIDEARAEYGLDCLPAAPAPGQYQAIFVAVGHHQLVEPAPTTLRPGAWPDRSGGVRRQRDPGQRQRRRSAVTQPMTHFKQEKSQLRPLPANLIVTDMVEFNDNPLREASLTLDQTLDCSDDFGTGCPRSPGQIRSIGSRSVLMGN